ncbi:MAG: hypothetical protein R3324_13660 [Halobacteriales archaeon]|nr:hypothetical protein [Halobacteriales archaeon]
MIEETSPEMYPRRPVLKASAVAAGLGLTGLVGTAAAKGKGPVNGGMAMIASSVLDDYEEGDSFQIVQKLPASNPWAPTAIAPSCNGGPETVSFWPYLIVDENGDHPRYLFFPEDKDVKLGDALHVFHNAEPHCSEVGDGTGRHWVKVRVKPARGRP